MQPHPGRSGGSRLWRRARTPVSILVALLALAVGWAATAFASPPRVYLPEASREVVALVERTRTELRGGRDPEILARLAADLVTAAREQTGFVPAPRTAVPSEGGPIEAFHGLRRTVLEILARLPAPARSAFLRLGRTEAAALASAAARGDEDALRALVSDFPLHPQAGAARLELAARAHERGAFREVLALAEEVAQLTPEPLPPEIERLARSARRNHTPPPAIFTAYARGAAGPVPLPLADLLAPERLLPGGQGDLAPAPSPAAVVDPTAPRLDLPTFATRTGDLLLYTDSVQVYARNATTGRLAGLWPGPARAPTLQPLPGIARSVAVAAGVATAPLKLAHLPGVPEEARTYATLVAFDLDSTEPFARPLWRWPEPEGAHGTLTCASPPVATGNAFLVAVTTVRAEGELHLALLDARTGHPIWVRFVGAVRREQIPHRFHPAEVGVADGSAWVLSGMGFAVSLDTRDGRPRHAFIYPPTDAGASPAPPIATGPPWAPRPLLLPRDRHHPLPVDGPPWPPIPGRGSLHIVGAEGRGVWAASGRTVVALAGPHEGSRVDLPAAASGVGLLVPDGLLIPTAVGLAHLAETAGGGLEVVEHVPWPPPTGPGNLCPLPDGLAVAGERGVFLFRR